MKVLTFSTKFPAKHPKAGEPTFFVEQIYNGIGLKIGTTKQTGDIPEPMWSLVNDFVLLDGDMKKHHTIRAGNRWKEGEWFSPRIWGDDINPKSGKRGAYQSKQIEFAPPIQIKKIWDIEIEMLSDVWMVKINGISLWDELTDFVMDDFMDELATNDGLSIPDFIGWFKIHQKKDDRFFKGQILCWNESLNYCSKELPTPERSVAQKA